MFSYQGGCIGLFRLAIALFFGGTIAQTTAPINIQASPEPPVQQVQVVQRTEKPKERSVKPKKVVPKPVVKEVVPPAPVATPPIKSSEIMQLAGIPEADWSAVDFIISHESGWNHLVWNGAGSGAYGLCQSLPANKMASAGADYMTNPVTQMKWCHSYALGRYGSWQAAQSFWLSNSWW